MTPIKRLFPFLNWLLFDADSVRHDLVAGISVAIVLIPQSLAFAHLAGLPAYYGLYAALLPGVVAALWGTSKQLSTGPIAIGSLLTIFTVAPLIATMDSAQYIVLVIGLTLLVGLLQLLLGILKFSAIANFISQPVIYGFINAVAIMIVLSQLDTVLGISIQPTEHFLYTPIAVFQLANDLHVLSLVMAISALVIMIAVKKFLPQYPGVWLAVILTTLLSWGLGFEELGGVVIGKIPEGLPDFRVPDLSLELLGSLFGSALVISLVGFSETLSITKALAAKTRDKTDANQELIGQGMANIVGAFFQAIPTGGSFSCSLVNLKAGARTGLSSVFSSLLILVSLLFFTPFLYHLPQAVLAAIIMLTVFNMTNFSAFKNAWRTHRHDGIAAGVTFVSTLVFAPNLAMGLLMGVTLSIGLYLYRSLQPRVAVLGQHSKLGNLSDSQIQDMVADKRIITVRFDASLYFANASHFENYILNACAEQPSARYILVVGNGINQLDATGAEALAYLLQRLSDSGTVMLFSGLKRQVVDVLRGAGLYTRIGAQNIFSTEGRALNAIHQWLTHNAEDSNIYPLNPNPKTQTSTIG